MMTPDDVHRFLMGRTLNAFDPATGARAAAVTYRPDGTCALRFADGAEEGGIWGLEGDTYWTRYDQFRGGERNGFRLELLREDIAQAWHVDGSRAFIQTPLEELPEGIAG
ncbi:hypothetical protein GCM10011360_15640 [Primorskyibacter flagellatus]|uniref:Uncharacterized protein n=1 Tax=Primorskyibacter flagellatus TaxID=1387277 RepID=A0A917EFK4_9RHOB|nr:hypothetical protein [Primorskyibacter flagellatus]GGE28303.1 hypothetical protein GCM10011360_15640 [Primorskyibacter flagellatus]